MKTNVGRTDRTIRILLGIGLFAFFFVSGGNVRWVGLLGLIALVTGIIGTCPLYSLIGTNTCDQLKDS
jgi:hypothetical protein